MAVTQYWFSGPSGGRNSSGSFSTTPTAWGYCGFAHDGYYFGERIVIQCGGYTGHFPCPYADDKSVRLNIQFPLTASAGTPFSATITSTVLGDTTVSAPLPQNVSGTHTLSFDVANGWWDIDWVGYTEWGWGGTLPNVYFDDGGSAAAAFDALFFGHGL